MSVLKLLVLFLALMSHANVGYATNPTNASNVMDDMNDTTEDDVHATTGWEYDGAHAHSM